MCMVKENLEFKVSVMSRGEAKIRSNLRIIIYLTVFFLVFEGLLRKLVPAALGLGIFFFKDFLCIAALIVLSKLNDVKVTTAKFRRSWMFLFLSFIPLFLNTVFRDPILAFFGMKQYLLYAVIALAVPNAFPPADFTKFSRFVKTVSILLIPTTFVAVVQNALPASHWLNLSVAGESLEAFSAAGYLRVGSTFSFPGQYSWFINFVCILIPVRMTFLSTIPANIKVRYWERVMIMILIVMLLIGAFITGGRTAVLGSGISLVLGFILASIKSPSKVIIQGIAFIFATIFLIGLLRVAKPEFFAVYDDRSDGSGGVSQSEEIGVRVLRDSFHWATWLFEQDLLPQIIGNGIGVTSNGSEKLSRYAKDIKERGLGGESDFDTTSWEGGLYLMMIWYGYRIWVAVFCFQLWRKLKNKHHSIAVSFLMAYVLITALYSALSKQPPVAIWFWLAVGSLFTLSNHDQYLNLIAQKKRMRLKTPLSAN